MIPNDVYEPGRESRASKAFKPTTLSQVRVTLDMFAFDDISFERHCCGMMYSTYLPTRNVSLGLHIFSVWMVVHRCVYIDRDYGYGW